MKKDKLKKFGEFIKEEFIMGPETAPETTPETTPDTETVPDEEPGERPSRPGITPTHIPSEEDAPLALLPEEEEGEYKGEILMRELAHKLNTTLNKNGYIEYGGKKINFYSETEKFHIDKKKFDKVDDVVNYLNNYGGDR
jgi:hypothetical protein